MEHNLTQPSHVKLQYPYYLKFEDTAEGERLIDVVQAQEAPVEVGDVLYIGIPTKYEVLSLTQPRAAKGNYSRGQLEWVRCRCKPLPLQQ